MSDILIGTISGLGAGVMWGVADWLTPRNKDKLSFWQINLIINLAGVACYLALFLITLPHQMPSQEIMLKAVLGSVFLTSGYVFFVKALTLGPVAVVVPLSSIYPMVTLALSVIFLNAIFTGIQVVAMVTIIIGAVLLAYEKNYQRLPLRTLHRANYLTIMSVLLWGTAFFILNPLITKENWQVLLLILDSVGLIIAFTLLAIVYKSHFSKAAKQAVATKNTWIAGTLLVTGTAALYWGAGQIGDVIIPLVISSVSPLLAAGLEAVIDNKKLGILKYAGALAAVAGIVLLNL
jgi:drug/metabolite transporter (DMT)-like permease